MEPLRWPMVHRIRVPGGPARARGLGKEAGLQRGQPCLQSGWPGEVGLAVDLCARDYRDLVEEVAPSPLGVRAMHLHRDGDEHLGCLRGGAQRCVCHGVHDPFGDARNRVVRHSLRLGGHLEQARRVGGQAGEHGIADGAAELLRDGRAADLHHDLGGDRRRPVSGSCAALRLHGGRLGAGDRRQRDLVLGRQAAAGDGDDRLGCGGQWAGRQGRQQRSLNCMD
mmetsp:Transcript_117082/g.338446  ORF Transcript_117082/g.338446 Transcript_117082/m.338446 type:complete len:224 (+) Transcript_117082:913-1584(+)